MSKPLAASVFRDSDLPLPKAWPEKVKAAAIHALSIAHFIATVSNGWCSHSRIPKVRQTAEANQANETIARLRRAAEIKDTLMKRLKAGKPFLYTATERMAILELKAACGWSIAETARQFLVATSTIVRWMKRLQHNGPNALLQMDVPVNRHPDFVRHFVRKLKALFPWMGKVRIAHIVTRAGHHLAATSAGRILKEPNAPTPDPELQHKIDQAVDEALADDSAVAAGGARDEARLPSDEHPRPDRCATPTPMDGDSTPVDGDGTSAGPEANRKPRRIHSRHSNHTWHPDFTLVPATLGLWCSWIPFALPQRWPFCWWVAVVLDHYSRKALAAAVFECEPTGEQTARFLDRVVRIVGRAPKHIITDKGSQFFQCAAYEDWLARHRVKPRFGKVGRHGSIAVIERFIRTLKDEATRKVVMPMLKGAALNEVKLHLYWYNHFRPHMTLDAATPQERCSGRTPAHHLFRYEPRPRYPRNAKCAAPQAPLVGPSGTRLELRVAYLHGRKHLPVIELRRVA